MSNYVISCCSTADLTREHMLERNIKYACFHYELDGKEYIDIIGQNANKNVTIGYGDIPYGPLQVMYLCADITALREDTGFEPRYSFEDGIKETIEWCRTQNL